MLSRTSRLAASLVILAGAPLLATPGSAATPRFDCGDSGSHSCCVDGGDVCDKDWCCFFEGSGGPPIFCGCEY